MAEKSWATDATLGDEKQQSAYKTSFAVCGMYLMCTGTLNVVGVLYLLDLCGQYHEIRIVSMVIYWQIFYLNNFMYMLRIKVYRDAYIKIYKKFYFKFSIVKFCKTNEDEPVQCR